MVEENVETVVDPPGSDNVPPKDIVPKKSTSLQIREALMMGASKKDLIARGFNANSIRTIASELKKEFNGEEFGREKITQAEAKYPSKGTPPEALIHSMNIPNGVDGLKEFEMGMKFGLSTLIMGVRMAQELSAIGVSQAQPLIKMASEMRAGEIAAAKSAAGEAASMAAGTILQEVMPLITSLQQQQTRAVVEPSSDPMKGMMSRIVEPLMQDIIGKLIPGASTPQPSGWTRKQE